MQRATSTGAGTATLVGLGQTAQNPSPISWQDSPENNPASLLIHDGYIYWAGTAAIGRVKMDGMTHYQPRFITLPGGYTGEGPFGLATDNQFLYWGGYGKAKPGVGGAIGRARLDGSHVNAALSSTRTSKGS